MANKRFRIKDEDALAIGLKLNKSGLYQLPKQKGEELQKFRESKKSAKKETPESENKEKPFVLSAWNDAGFMMDIDTYCKHYQLPKEDVESYKLVSHTGTPFYNIKFKEKSAESDFDFDALRKILKKEIKSVYQYKKVKSQKKSAAVLKWSDLHFGAYIKNLMNTHDFDKDILLDGLLESVENCNNIGFKKVHVHINGDLIESFSGLNHVNSWMSMENSLIGANVVKLCSKMLHKAFSKINNLGCIKIVAGNHDRLSKDNKEDVKGGAAELIAFCLELMGYDVEFNPFVITHFVDGINHINLHGDKGISKQSTEKIILDYGIQGEYNLINEGHLHSVIEKLSIKKRENFEILKDDSILHRRFYLPSFFTGNYYSLTLGFTTNPGYFIIWSNNRNKPQFFNGSV